MLGWFTLDMSCYQVLKQKRKEKKYGSACSKKQWNPNSTIPVCSRDLAMKFKLACFKSMMCAKAFLEPLLDHEYS